MNEKSESYTRNPAIHKINKDNPPRRTECTCVRSQRLCTVNEKIILFYYINIIFYRVHCTCAILKYGVSILTM